MVMVGVVTGSCTGRLTA